MSKAPHTWHRLYVSQILSTGRAFQLDGDQSHYLIQVLRAQIGDPVRLFNGGDGEWEARLTDIPKNKKAGVTLTPTQKLREQTQDVDLTLLCAPIKRAHFEFMIMKATELGVHTIQPILTARTQIRDSNPERLRSIAIEAAEQSERLTVPEFLPALSLAQTIETWPSHRLAILCAEYGDAQPAAQAFSGALAHARESVAILTGPEGGFTQDEMALIRGLPEVLPIRLGPRILRADTAAIAAISCWQALCGDWQNRDFRSRDTTDQDKT